jgi:hypothetical protein
MSLSQVGVEMRLYHNTTLHLFLGDKIRIDNIVYNKDSRTEVGQSAIFITSNNLIE